MAGYPSGEGGSPGGGSQPWPVPPFSDDNSSNGNSANISSQQHPSASPYHNVMFDQSDFYYCVAMSVLGGIGLLANTGILLKMCMKQFSAPSSLTRIASTLVRQKGEDAAASKSGTHEAGGITSVLLVNQSALDLFACLAVTLTYALNSKMTSSYMVVSEMTGMARSAQSTLCLLLDNHILVGFGIYGSIANLVLISAERYVKIALPVTSRKYCRKWMLHIAIVISWWYGLMAVAPALVAQWNNSQCVWSSWVSVDSASAESYGIWLFIWMFVMPLSAFIFFYGRILRAVRQRYARIVCTVERRIERGRGGGGGSGGGEGGGGEKKGGEKGGAGGEKGEDGRVLGDGGSTEIKCGIGTKQYGDVEVVRFAEGAGGACVSPTCDRAMTPTTVTTTTTTTTLTATAAASGVMIAARSQLKIIRALVFVISFFVLCWMPFSVYYLVVNLGDGVPSMATATNDNAMAAVVCIACFNVCVNPFLYAVKRAIVKAAIRDGTDGVAARCAAARRSVRVVGTVAERTSGDVCVNNGVCLYVTPSDDQARAATEAAAHICRQVWRMEGAEVDEGFETSLNAYSCKA